MNFRLAGRIAAGLGWCLLWALLTWRLARVEVAVVMIPEQPEVYQLFYDVGRGFNEGDSSRAILSDVGVRQTARFELPLWPEIARFRFDTGMQPGRTYLASFTVRSWAGATSWDAEAFKQRFRPGNAIRGFQTRDGLLDLTSAGRDPFVVSERDIGDELALARGWAALLAALAALAAVLVLRTIVAAARTARFAPARAWLAAHGWTLIVAALLGGALFRVSDLGEFRVRMATDATDAEAFTFRYRMGRAWRRAAAVSLSPPGEGGWRELECRIDDSFLWQGVSHLRLTIEPRQAPVRIRDVSMAAFFLDQRWGADALAAGADADSAVTVAPGQAIIEPADQPVEIVLAAPLNISASRLGRGAALLGLAAFAAALALALGLLRRRAPPDWLDQSSPRFTIFYRTVLGAILLWFLVQQVYLLGWIRWEIAPDASYHWKVIDVFSKQWTPFVPDRPGTYHLGALSTRAYLYYYLTGMAVRLNPFDSVDVLLVQFISLAFSLGFLFFLFRLARLATANGWVHLAVLAVVVNLGMFSFMAASVSYDPMVNFLAICGLYHLIRFLKDRRRRNLAILALVMAAGSLAKRTMLPLAALYALALMPALPALWRERKQFLAPLRGREWAQWALVVVFISLSAVLYGGNLLRYRALQPRCDLVLSHDACMKNNIYSRDYRMSQTTGSRADMGLISFLPRWFFHMEQTGLGLLVQRSTNMVKNTWELLAYNTIFLLALVVGVFYWRELWGNRPLLTGLWIAVGYAAVLVAVNYQGYLMRGVFGVAIQGRYLFPVLAPLAIGFIAPLMNRGGPWLRAALFLAIALVFIDGGALYFLERLDAYWLR